MTKEATIRATELYRSGGQVLRRVAVNKESLIVESNGYPIVALLPYAEYEALKRERARLGVERYLAEQKDLSRRVAADEVSDDEAMADARAAVAEARRERRRQR
jgi:prevent-host-death family protein